jgi:hypothetical protein
MTIVRPMKWLEVAQIIGSAHRYGFIVIDLPTILRSLAVLISSYPRAATVFPQFVVINPINNLCLVPHGIDGDEVETAAISVSAGSSKISVHLSYSLFVGLSLRRIGVITVTVAFADLTIAPVN